MELELPSPEGRYSILEFPKVKEMHGNHYRYKVSPPFDKSSYELRYPGSKLIMRFSDSLFRVRGYRDLDKESVKAHCLSSSDFMNTLYDFIHCLEYWSKTNNYGISLPVSLGDFSFDSPRVEVSWFIDEPSSPDILRVPIINL